MAASDALMEGGQATFDKAGEKVSFELEPKSVGLTKEQLEKYRNDPIWKPVRTVLFIVFWLAWIVMFATAIAIVVFSPKCAEKQKPEWWQTKISYQLLTSNFHDSNGDGIGDFKGVTAKIDLLRKLGVTTIYPTPVLQTSKNNFYDSYDVVDHLKVDERYGTEEDFKELIDAAHKRDMFLVMDLPVSSVSISHPWFQESKWEYFVTVDNNQTKASINFYSDPSLKNKKYLAYPTKDFPVLNWSNGRVHNVIMDSVKKFLHLGVDGFHIDHVSQLAFNADGTTNVNEALGRLKSITSSIKDYVNDHEELKEKKIVLFSSLRDLEDIHAQARETGDLHYIIDSDFATLNETNCRTGVAVCVHDALDKAYQRHQTDGYVPYWQFSNTDSNRLASRFSPENANLLNFIQLTLPGAISLYYGQELGLKNNVKNGQKGIMQWTPRADDHHGFTSDSFKETLFFGESADATDSDNYQTQYGLADSGLKLYQKLAKLRQREAALLVGETVRDEIKGDVISYSRYEMINGTAVGPIFTAAFNFGDQPASINVTSLGHIPKGRDLGKTEVVAFTSGITELKPRDKVNYLEAMLILPAKQAILLKL